MDLCMRPFPDCQLLRRIADHSPRRHRVPGKPSIRHERRVHRGLGYLQRKTPYPDYS